MDQGRLELLKKFVEEEPEDPFNWYALALEETKLHPKRAAELFDYVIENHPEYLPSYYHAGNLYLSLGNEDKAKAILQTGVDLAIRKGEQKIAQELNTLLSEVD